MQLSRSALAFVVDETHRAAELHWRRHSALPMKVILLTAGQAPELVALPTGTTFAIAERMIAERAAELHADAVVLTSLAMMTAPSVGVHAFGPLTLADLPQPDDDPQHEDVLLTIACWPVGEVEVSRISVVESGSTGARALRQSIDAQPVKLSAAEGVLAWLTALLPR